MARIGLEITARQILASDVVVLVPYAQLMQIAREAWRRRVAASTAGAAFMPRFETTRNWGRSLAVFHPSPHDLRIDGARDLLTAAALLQQAGLGRHHRALAGRLTEAAWSLARLAAALEPRLRADWAQQMTAALGAPDGDTPNHLESWLGRIAIAWAANSAYATDSILQARPGFLVLLKGLQTDPTPRLLWRMPRRRLDAESLRDAMLAVSGK